MPPPLSPTLRHDLAARFRALGDETRLAMLEHLVLHGPASVSELAAAIDSSHANVSKHLRILLECGIVAREKRGTSAIYSVDDPNIMKICDLACARIVQIAELRARDFGISAAGI